ncbi:MAG: FecR domain-containing protein, partial [Pirellulaceae bacterium]|nr:FecR domain-containing protein [Pirellulaceae bacterium]
MSDSFKHEPFDELCDLIAALREGCITPEQQSRLEELVRHDEEACRVYVHYMHLCANLRWRMMHESPPPSSDSHAPAGKSPVLGFLGECFNQGAAFLWNSNVFTLLVAIGLPMAMFALVFVLVHETPPSPVAVIARSRDCAGRLDGQPATFYPGSNLFAQQTLAIDKGLVEIQFADGASAVLEAPATFEILGGNAGSLTRGRLAAVVPPEARGFAVETPSAKVVDLGTEFGVWVDDDGRVETHVFGGQVEVTVPVSTDSPGPAARLGKGEAVQIAAADVAGESPKIVRIPAAAKQFTRSVALPEPTILFAHHGSADPTTEGWT